MAKIKDIARRAGVSLSAVSLAINGRKGLGVDTRERILKIAHEMNYQQSNKSKSGGVIRFLKIALHGNTINESHNLFINGYLDGVIDITSKLGLTLEVVNYEYISVEQIVKIENKSIPASGLIILGTEFEKADFISLKYLNTPFVIIDNMNDFLPYDFVNMNNRGAVYKVLEYLKRTGMTDIGLIYSDAHTPNFHQRKMAFHELSGLLGLHYKSHNLICVNSSSESAYAIMCKILNNSPQLPQVFFCINDTIAYGCIKALQDHYWKIPDDISIIGFDDLHISGIMAPALTTIQVSKKEMGRAATNLLVSKLTDSWQKTVHRSILVSGVLIKRNSVKDMGPKR